jgi:hypothetical protein
MPMRARPPDDPRLSLPSALEGGLDRIVRWGVLACVVVGLAWSIPHWPNAWRWLTGREPLYMPEHAANLGEVDLELVHRDRWDTWVAATSHATPGAPDPGVESARTQMHEAIAADQNLTELFEELDGIVTSPRLEEKSVQRRALWLVRAWNHYLEREEQPYFVRGNVVGGERVAFVAHAYEVVARATGTVDGDEVRIRALSRLDSLNLREAVLGAASSADEGVIVVADQLLELSLDHLWPMLAQPGDSVQRTFAPAVALELRAGLPAEAFALLEQTAATRRSLVDGRASIMDRGCSPVWLRQVPFDGLDRKQLDWLAERTDVGACAGVKDDELQALWKGSEALQGHEGLREATERLTAFTARSIAVQELRRVADDLEYGRSDEWRPCGVCGAEDGEQTRQLAAAYLAEIAWSRTPAVTLYRICWSTGDDMGPWGRARAVVMGALELQCPDGVPADVETRAQQLEREQFGHGVPLVLGEDFPERLPVVWARDKAQDDEAEEP